MIRIIGRQWILCFFLLAGEGLAPADPATDDWPLVKGNYWVYQGQVSWAESDPKTGSLIKVHTDPITWRSEVVEAYKSYTAQAFLLRGFPSDLAWYKPGRKPAEQFIFQVGTNYYHLASTGGDDKRFKSLKDNLAADALIVDENRDELNRAEMLFDCPLAMGKRFGGSDATFADTIRTSRYAWLVQSIVPFNAKAVKGLSSRKGLQMFETIFSTNPDDCEIDFVPGVGIVAYRYHHHGTPMQVDIHLVEFGHGR